MKKETSKTTLPENFWDVIEKHLPNYYKRADVFENNLLSKFVDGELLDIREEGEIINLCEGDIEKAKCMLELSNKKLYEEALKAESEELKTV